MGVNPNKKGAGRTLCAPRFFLHSLGRFFKEKTAPCGKGGLKESSLPPARGCLLASPCRGQAVRAGVRAQEGARQRAFPNSGMASMRSKASLSCSMGTVQEMRR